ncbi:hypothetical protein ABZ307_30375 [Streptomyces griseorubiginosus]|uniref:hypothetical protein n=1 Tax=Streptomyces griseorubiginosus TaxID=67304 RepID=UPI0033A1F486
MVRARSGAFPAGVALVAVRVSVCGAAAPQTSREELFQEYVRSTDGPPSGAARQAVRDIAGAPGAVFERTVLVRTPAGITSVSGCGKVVAAHRRTGEVRP